MKSFSKRYPLWLLIKGTNVKKAFLFSVQHYLEENNLSECTILTMQNGVVVNHPLNETVIKREDV